MGELNGKERESGVVSLVPLPPPSLSSTSSSFSSSLALSLRTMEQASLLLLLSSSMSGDEERWLEAAVGVVRLGLEQRRKRERERGGRERGGGGEGEITCASPPSSPSPPLFPYLPPSLPSIHFFVKVGLKCRERARREEEREEKGEEGEGREGRGEAFSSAQQLHAAVFSISGLVEAWGLYPLSPQQQQQQQKQQQQLLLDSPPHTHTYAFLLYALSEAFLCSAHAGAVCLLGRTHPFTIALLTLCTPMHTPTHTETL